MPEDGDWIRRDGPSGQIPVLDAPKSGTKLTMLSAFSNQGLAGFELIAGAIDIERLTAVTDKLIADSDREVVLILNA